MAFLISFVVVCLIWFKVADPIIQKGLERTLGRDSDLKKKRYVTGAELSRELDLLDARKH